MKSVSRILIFTALGVAATVQALAATVTTDQNQTGYTVISADLLQTRLSSTDAAGNFNIEKITGAGASTLVDGEFGSLGGQAAGSATAGDSAGSHQIIYTFDTSLNAMGYNLSSIATYAGWDGARYQQAYDIYVHAVGTTAGTYSLLSSVTYQPDSLGTPNCTKVTSTDLGTSANGVDQIKFVFNRADPVNGYAGYREIDVLGTAADTMVSNGSFEAPALTAGAFQEGSPATGWTKITASGAPSTYGGGIVSNGAGYGNPNAIDGTQAALLKGAGGMEQTVSGFEAGKQYSISLYSAGRAGFGPNPFQVLLGGSALSFSGSTIITPEVNAYNLYKATFTASSSSMALQFLSTLTDSTDLSSYVDNVQIAMVPEPSMLTLLVAGFVGLLAYAWRKR